MLFHDKNIEYWLIYNVGRFFFYLYTYSDCKNIYITVTFIFVRFSFTKITRGTSVFLTIFDISRFEFDIC